MKYEKPDKHVRRIIKGNNNRLKDSLLSLKHEYNFLFIRIPYSIVFYFRFMLLIWLIFSGYYLYIYYNKNVKDENKINSLMVWAKGYAQSNYNINILYENSSILYKQRFDSLTRFYKLDVKDGQRYLISWPNICFWIDYFQIKHSDIVKAQVLHETNFLKSDICKYNRNIIGMRLAHRRRTIAMTAQDEHAFYQTYVECLYDYKLWQEYCYGDSKMDYFDFLNKAGYATDPHYTNRLKEILNTKEYHHYFINNK